MQSKFPGNQYCCLPKLFLRQKRDWKIHKLSQHGGYAKTILKLILIW